MSQQTAKNDIKRILSRFANAKVDDLSEADTESKFVEPLIEALGWKIESDDIVKRERLGENYPDYTFKITGTRKFVLEAKAAGVNLDGTYKKKTFVEQALDYAKRSDCTWVVLTNFSEFRLYSTDKKEDNGLIFRIHHSEYETTGLERLWLFSKGSTANSELDKYGESFGFKKQRIPIDKILLNDLIQFRELLSIDIFKNNPDLKDRDLIDEIIQKLLDRLIFIRNCEDIGIEQDKLIAFENTKNIIKRLREKFSDRNDYGYYNSALFAKHECDNKELVISDEVLTKIIKGMYESQSSGIKYNFAEIKSDILGSIYEQYLSHLLNKRKKGALGENLGKKKQQGIYYTPAYVVDYIVKHTLGEVLRGKETKQIENVKVLDMACGSGSFLIKCYDVLEQAYLGNLRTDEKAESSQYAFEMQADKAKHLKPIKKANIIEKNIFGVDLDKQAVEISQLNLLLKIKEKIRLPFTNIICGDSLLDENNSEYDIGLFEQFSSVKKNEFDVIVGNPPYVDVKELDDKVVKALFKKYDTVENRMNLYSVFVHRAIELLKPGGYFGFIIPNSILLNDSYKKVRKLMLENVCLKEIIRMPDNVFEGVTVETIILIFKKDKTNAPKNECNSIIYKSTDTINHIGIDNASSVSKFKQKDWIKANSINLSLSKESKGIMSVIEKDTKPLIYYTDFCLGLTPYDAARGQSKEDIENKIYHSDKQKTKFHKPLLSGDDITRYGVHWGGNSYIKYGEWLGAPREQKFFIRPRILVRQIISGKPARIYAGFTNKELYNSQIAFNILVNDVFKKDVGIKYLTAIMNSNLMSYYHREKFLDPTKVKFQKILIQNAKKFPIKIASKSIQQQIEHLVDAMIGLSSQLHKGGDTMTEKKRSIIKQMEVTDKKINLEVYKIYNVLPADQEIIDNSFVKQSK